MPGRTARRSGAAIGIALALLLLSPAAAFAIPEGSASYLGCQDRPTDAERGACYRAVALETAGHARGDPARAPSYLATALLLCNNLPPARTGDGGNASRDGCWSGVAGAMAPFLWAESADVCGAAGEGLRDGCLLAVAARAPAREWAFAASVCQRVSDPSARSRCLAAASQENGACDAALGEDCRSQAVDCPCPGDLACAPGRAGADARGCARPSCGDGSCDGPLETDALCCADCGCPRGQGCTPSGCSAAAQLPSPTPSPAPSASAAPTALPPPPPTPSPAPTALSTPAPAPLAGNPAIGERGKGCLFETDCTSRICRDGACAFLGDGEACTAPLQCESFNCRSELCCAPGRRCCSGMEDCTGESECDGSLHYCVEYAPGEKEGRETVGMAFLVLFAIASVIAVGLLRGAIMGVSKAIASGGKAERGPLTLMCERCGRRTASHGSLCTECHKNMVYVYGGKQV